MRRRSFATTAILGLGACTPASPAVPAVATPVEGSRPVQAPAASPRVTDCVDTPEPPPPPPRDELRRTVPTKNTRHGPVTCMADREVWFDDEGRMRVCTFAKAVELAGIPIAKEAYTHLYPSGTPEQTTLGRAHELTSAAGHRVPCDADFVSLGEDGTLRMCTPAVSITIDSIAVRAGETLAFHPTGELAGATIHAPYEAPLATFPAGTRLQWHESGDLAGGWLHEPMQLQGHLARFDFELHESGGLAKFDLGRDETIDGHPIPEFGTAFLRTNGSLERAIYESDSGFMPHGERWTDTTHIRFDCAGTVLEQRVEHFQADKRPPKFR